MLPVPAADPLLATVAASHPHLVRAGLPAHLTVLYPFVPAPDLDGAVLGTCARLVQGLAPIPVRFARCRARPGLVYLAPEPPEQVQHLLGSVWATWPDLPPYGGRHADAAAHVTIALGGDDAEHAAVVRLVEPHLPIMVELTELYVAVTNDPGTNPTGWQIRSRIAFGGR